MKKLTILLFALLLCCMALFVSCDKDPCKDGHTEAIDAAVAPTCTEKGKTEGKHCSVCNEVLVAQTEVAALGHTEAIDAAVAPTCTEKGKTEGKHCSVCNGVLVAQTEVAALGHTYGEWTVTTPATCTVKGEQAQTCSVCKDVKKQEIAAHGHSNKEAVVENKINATCTVDGSYDSVIYCSVCNAEVSRKKETIKAPGHTNKEPVIENQIDATCTVDGSYDSVIYCSVCNDEVSRKKETIKAPGHNYVPVVTPPTVKDQGYTTHTCSVCSDSYVDSYVPATGSLGLAYTVNADGKTCTVTGMGTCTDTEVYVGEKIDGYTVTVIGEKAFAENSTITFIKIPDTVKEIGRRAFYKCTALPEITIPSSVTEIGTQIFYGCDALKTVYYNSNYGSQDNPIFALKSIETIVFGGTSVPSYIACNCANLKNVTIPDGVTSIGYEAFYNCTSLTSITLPDGVTSIGDDAFYNCTSLTSITLPDSVTSIGYSAFEGCTSLASITLPDSVTIIHSEVFYNCKNLTSITLPDSVTSIGSSAFEDCSSLTSIIIPDSVKNIGSWAFSDCTSLTSVTIPDSVTSIGYEAFYNCTSLTSITIPDSVINIGDRAFEGCTGLASITIPDSVTSIGEGAFYNCTSLTSITIPDSVTSIGNYAFSGCTDLTSITIPNGVTSIGGSAFSDCTSLTSITIPDSVTSIGDYAFSGCTSLKTVYYTGTTEDWANIRIGSSNSYLTNTARYYYSETQPTELGNYWRYVDGIPTPWPPYIFILKENDTYGFAVNPSAKLPAEFVIPSTYNGKVVTSIEDNAFLSCTSLISLTIPDSITRIGSHAFQGCSNLESITIPNSVTSIGDYAFYNCFDLTTITIPDSVISIGDYTFCNCVSLTTITVPNSVIAIGNSAFLDCVSMQIICYVGTAAEWDSIRIGSENDSLINAVRYYFSKDEPVIPPAVVVPLPDVWDGTADTSWFDINNPKTVYILTTAEQFAGFIDLRQQAYTRSGVFSSFADRYYFEGVTIKLERDIILNEGTAEDIKALAALGQAKQVAGLNSNAFFKGVFDGQGHTISGIYIDCTSSGVKGIFGGLGDNCVIKNLKIRNAYFNASEKDKSIGGILVARAKGQNMLISNVTIVDALMEESTAEFSGVGILLGRVDEGASITLENCHTSGTISFPTMGTSAYGFGGIVGYVQDATLHMNNCSSSATVIAPNNCGGLIGVASEKSNVTLGSGCTFTGTIICEGENKSDYVGNNATIQPAN